jgi:hypothetical protein
MFNAIKQNRAAGKVVEEEVPTQQVIRLSEREKVELILKRNEVLHPD